MRTACRKVLLFGMVMVVLAAALARGLFAGPGGPGPQPLGPGLLFDKRVQAELKLAPEQLAKITKIGNDVEAAHKEESDKLGRRYEELANRENELNLLMYAEVRKAAADFLKPEQLKRFRELEVRLLGVNAFEDPEVRRVLGLTDKQLAALKAVKEKAQKEGSEFSNKQQAEAGDDPARQREAYQKVQEKQAALGKETLDKMLGQLTEEQRKKWTDLRGGPLPLALGGDTVFLYGSSGGLYYPGVQQEIKLGDEQKGKLNAAMKKATADHADESKKLKGEQDAYTQQIQKFTTKLGEEAEQELAKAVPTLLTADQQKQLRQIGLRLSVQMHGFTAFADPEVQKELKLTDAQKKEANAAVEQYFKDLQTVQQNVFKEAGENVDKFNELMRSRRGALDKETLEKLTGKLSAEQKKAWQELRDNPFDKPATFTGPQPKPADSTKRN
jgi:hypothetical protein